MDQGQPVLVRHPARRLRLRRGHLFQRRLLQHFLDEETRPPPRPDLLQRAHFARRGPAHRVRHPSLQQTPEENAQGAHPRDHPGGRRNRDGVHLRGAALPADRHELRHDDPVHPIRRGPTLRPTGLREDLQHGQPVLVHGTHQPAVQGELFRKTGQRLRAGDQGQGRRHLRIQGGLLNVRRVGLLNVDLSVVRKYYL